MSHEAQQILRRPGAIALVLAGVLGLGLLAFHGGARLAQAQQIDRISVVLRWLNAEQRGDLDTAVAQFADNAVFVGTSPTGACPTQAPCTDLEGIRQQLQGNIATHNCYTFRSLQVSGAVVTGVREIQADSLRAIGVEHNVQAFIVAIPDDKITFFAGTFDLADPQAAQIAAIRAGAQPAGTPLPAPTTPCPALL